MSASAAETVLTSPPHPGAIDAGLDFRMRHAQPSDNEELVALAAACPMVGELTLRIDRYPDFFALNRLEGERWKVAVAERAGTVVGCAAFSERLVFVNGSPMQSGYAGDLKVHPRHRNTVIADALCFWAERACDQLPARAPALITVLAGNTAMERRLSGPRGVPRFNKIGTIRTHSLTVLWKRGRLSRRGLGFIDTAPAQWSDIAEMGQLWEHVAPGRQLAPVMTAASLADWIRQAPGLDISSYRVARSPTGELLGFLAIWDQRSFKQLTVVGYSPRMAAVRKAFNVFAPIVGAEPLPAPGAPLRCATALHLCVPGDRPEVLRALLIDAHNDLRHSGYSFINVGLDVRDPLSRGVDGLFAQPTDVNAYVLATRRGVDPETLDERPLHYEIALV